MSRDIPASDLAPLVRVVVEDAEAACRRREDRALNESRQIVLDAEDRVAELRAAAQDLGRVRGEAADAAAEQAADREIEEVHAGAFDALWDRFRQRLVMRLDELPNEDGYAAALEHWCGEAVSAMDAPTEVFTASRDRAAVYAALLVAGAEDFHVRVDHGVRVGFVVRDLEGRTVFDRRPDALLESRGSGLRSLLEAEVPAFRPEASASESSPV